MKLLPILQTSGFHSKIFGCQNEVAFNSEKWKEKGVDWQLADTREKMVSDLISTDTLIGMNSKRIIDLLGDPDFEKEESHEFLLLRWEPEVYPAR